MGKRFAVPATALRAVTAAVRPSGYSQKGRRGLWVKDGEEVLVAVTITASDASEDREFFWLTLGSHAISKTVFRSVAHPDDDPHYANFICWSVEQQHFGAPWSYEYRLDDAEPVKAILEMILREHLLPAAEAMLDPEHLFAHLRRNVFMRCEGPLQLLQFVPWALERGQVGDAQEAVRRYAIVEAEIGDPFPAGLLDELKDLTDKYPAFDPVAAVEAAGDRGR